jgi:EAL domain-containing protein (putative c-di-GMP-specific phosphodiesterase class I)
MRDMGCEVAQGAFVGAPMPAAQLAGWHEAWTQRYASMM